MNDEKPRVNLPPPTRTYRLPDGTEVEFRPLMPIRIVIRGPKNDRLFEAVQVAEVTLLLRQHKGARQEVTALFLASGRA